MEFFPEDLFTYYACRIGQTILLAGLPPLLQGARYKSDLMGNLGL
jgi:hypothetical protein